ncbi:ADP-ribosylation factor-like protein 9 [Aix galericulata]|nr:ADP-ribosylation factor-like protein 9 [Aix galericulata]
MGSRLRPAALCGAALAMAGGAALAAWAWARLRGRGAPPAAQQGPGAGRGEPPAPRLCPFPSSIGVAPQGKRQGRQILVLGLDGAGKSSLLQALATNQVKRSLAPTEGFNAVCIATEESQMEFLEIGGSESLRSYWKMYLPQVLLLIYVVDSADHARLPVAKQLLHQLVENNSTLPVVVLAHKQDLEGAYCITDIHDALALSDIGDKRKMFLIGTHVAEDGSEISSSMKDAKELIAELFLEMQ